MTDLAPLRVFLARKDAVRKVKNVSEIIFYQKNRYLPHNEERLTYIEGIPSQVKKNNSHLKQYLI